MQKVLIVFDGYNFSNSAMDFVKNIASEKPILLTGIFLSSIDFRSLFGYPLALGGYLSTIQYDNELFEKNVAFFESFCIKNNIEYRVHDDMGSDALDMLKMETRFADLLVVGSEAFFKDVEVATPGEYLKETMHDSECPILVLPEDYSTTEKLILTYDGSGASMYAIKLFAYLFPELCSMETILVYASDKHEDIPHIEFLEEFVCRHYINLDILKLDIVPEKYFDTWLVNNKNAIVISGAYGRSGISGILAKSFMSNTIKAHKLPIFIAHN